MGPDVMWRRDRTAIAATMAAVVGIAVQAFLPSGPARDLLFLAVAIGAAVAVVRARRRMSGPPRRAWALLSVGLVAWVLGDVIWTVLEWGLDVAPYPSIADLAYLVSYPLLAMGLVRAFPAPSGRRPVWWLDAFLMMGGLLLILWLLVLDPALNGWGADPAAGLVGAFYPVGDALLIVTLARSGNAMRERTGAYRLVVIAVSTILIADLLFQVGQTWQVRADQLSLLDPLWLVGYVLLAEAARRQAVHDGGPLAPGTELGGTHFVLMAGSASVVPLTLVVSDLSGGPIPVVEVCTIGVLMVVAMMTRFWGVLGDLRATNSRLARDAVTDPLTGLANAAGLDQHIGSRAEGVAEDARPALLLIGLDGYRDVVETLGHRWADEMLRAVARDLADVAPPHALAARMNRDLFGISVWVSGDTKDTEADALAARILARLGTAFSVSGMSVVTGAAIGVAVSPEQDATLGRLAERAEVALGAARGRTQRIATDLPAATGDGGPAGAALLHDLVGGVERGELVVEFQPVTSVATHDVMGAEALVRWRHPVHGLLGPAAFVPAAERTGLIRPVTLAVIDTALRWCATWRESSPEFTVAVNVSAHDLHDPRLVEDVRAALDRHALPASALTLEVTETMAMRDVPRGERTLRALATLGVQLAVDDYGVGYGSLNYLRRLPFTVLKVDRTFVAPATTDSVCAAILRSTVALGHALGMHVVAEGVEDHATFALLADLGCDSAQGWALGRPTTPQAFSRHLVGGPAASMVSALDGPTGS